MRSLTKHGIEAKDVSEVGVTRGLVAWYPLMGDTLDYAGSNHAVNNGAVATAEGYKFDGETDYIDGGPHKHLDQLDDQLTLSYVEKFKDAGSQDHPILAKNPNEGWMPGEGFVLGHGWSDNIYFGVGGNSKGNLPTPVVEDGNFYHVTLTYSSSVGVRLYVNGIEEFRDESWTGPIGANTENLWIGRANNRGGRFFGTLRDLRIHNVALTPEEVAIQAKLALNSETKTAMTDSCLYTQGQFKEVIC